MRKSLVIIAALATALSAGAQTLENPSFEMEGTQSDMAKGWSRWGDWINRETGWTPTKDGSCIIGYHHWQILKPDTSGLWQDLKVEAGKTYTFSVYANADKTTDGSKIAESVEIRLETTLDGSQSTIATKTYPYADLASGQDWSLLSVSGVAPNDTLRVLIIVTPAKEGPRGAAIKFDSASLKSGSTP